MFFILYSEKYMHTNKTWHFWLSITSNTATCFTKRSLLMCGFTATCFTKRSPSDVWIYSYLLHKKESSDVWQSCTANVHASKKCFE